MSRETASGKRTKRAGILLALLATALAGGCSVLRDQAELDSYYRAGASAGQGRLEPPDLHALVTSVAQKGATTESLIYGKRVRAIHVQSNGACAIVAVLNLDDARMVGGADVRGVHARNYRICGDRASLIGGSDLPPGYPDAANARATLDQARRAALLQGAQSAAFDGYRIETRRLGVDSANGCRPVETAISHSNLLVMHDVREVCQ